MTVQPIMAAFVFERRRQVELEAGFILAGQLIVDIPKQARMKCRQQRKITAIIQQLTDAARSGSLPEYGLDVGWHPGTCPANADWKDDGVLRIDSDAAQQMGLSHREAV
jgi:hypothetical protein